MCCDEDSALWDLISSGKESTQSFKSAVRMLTAIKSVCLPVVVQEVLRIKGETYTSVARSIPIFSTTSSDSRIPAVSHAITGIPPISRDTSSTSRVVPGSGVTMAACL